MIEQLILMCGCKRSKQKRYDDCQHTSEQNEQQSNGGALCNQLSGRSPRNDGIPGVPLGKECVHKTEELIP
ncbi:hypothetical protein D3C76_1382500 [compost metagenome]